MLSLPFLVNVALHPQGMKWQQFGLMALIGFIFHSGIEKRLSAVKTEQWAEKEQNQNLTWIKGRGSHFPYKVIMGEGHREALQSNKQTIGWVASHAPGTSSWTKELGRGNVIVT